MRDHSISERHIALGELGSLLPLATIGLLIANDHWLKFVFHDALTGKLSDLAICFVMPLLVSAAVGLIAGTAVRWRLLIGAATTVVVFSALEMSDVAGGWFIRAVAIVFGVKHTVLTRDPTDLLALTCVPLAVAYGLRRARSPEPAARWRRLRGALGLITGSLALMATSAPERCDKWSGPTVFQVDGDCGSGGVIVVEADRYIGELTITNQPALLAAQPIDSTLGVSERYDGQSCPYTLDQGDWEVTVGYCSTAGATSPFDASAGPDAGAPVVCQPGYRRCNATVESDGLWFTCHGADPTVSLCRSRLTVLP